MRKKKNDMRNITEKMNGELMEKKKWNSIKRKILQNNEKERGKKRKKREERN